jgi:hypothetical protein
MVAAVFWEGRYHRPVRKLIRIGLVILGVFAFLRWRKRRHESDASAPAVDPADDPADELRRKLAESRADESENEPEEPTAATVTDRRAEVHEQGRAALDEMTSSDES